MRTILFFLVLACALGSIEILSKSMPLEKPYLVAAYISENNEIFDLVQQLAQKGVPIAVTSNSEMRNFFKFEKSEQFILFKKGARWGTLNVYTSSGLLVQVDDFVSQMHLLLHAPIEYDSMQHAEQDAANRAPYKALVVAQYDKLDKSFVQQAFERLLKDDTIEFGYVREPTTNPRVVLIKSHLGEENRVWNESLEWTLRSYVEQFSPAIVQPADSTRVDLRAIICCYECKLDRKLAKYVDTHFGWLAKECL